MEEGEFTRSNFHGFNLFTIGPDHDAHSESTGIINLEESGQVFCPLCLERVSHDKIERIRDDLFENYVRGLFEALDQHGEKRHVRGIVLTILEVMLNRRDICVRSDHDFHNLLRIIYKILNSEKFCLNEFPAVTRMFAAISRRFTNSNPIPLVSVYKATEIIIDCAGRQLGKCLDENSHNLRSDVIKLLRSVYTTIRAYLELLGRFAIGRSSDLIFPLYDSDDAQMHSRIYHKDCQMKCLMFALNRLLPKTISHLRTITRLDRLDPLDSSLVVGFFEALRECFLSAVRVEFDELINYIINEDCLKLAHSFCYMCPDIEMRKATRSFLRVFVLHYTEVKFKPDAAFRSFATQQNNIETNHKNAIMYSKEKDKASRTIFYVMVNIVAYDKRSQYYNQDRLKKVISEVGPSFFYSYNSRVITKLYLYAAATVMRNVTVVENIEKFFGTLWNRTVIDSRASNFNDEFCSSEKVFFWAYRHPSFKKLVTWRSIKVLMENSSNILITHNTLRLVNDVFYKQPIIKYLENDESAIKLMERLTNTIPGCEFHVGDCYHKPLMMRLGAILPMLLFTAIQKLVSNLEDIEIINRTERLTKMILLWMDLCEDLDLLLDNDFIVAWFKVMDEMIARRLRNHKKFDELIVAFIKLIGSLIRTNHECLNFILDALNYTSLGLMYTLLRTYIIGDKLVESIADMIIAYYQLDYPLAHDVVGGLLEMNASLISGFSMNWMLSASQDLHALSVHCAQKTFKNQRDNLSRTVVATGLIHMVAKNPEILKINELTNTMKSFLSEEEIIHNPLLSRIKELLPPDLNLIFDDNGEARASPSLSPACSFVSDESDVFEEENISVMRILTQLQNEESQEPDNSCTIPESLYVSRSLIDRHMNGVDTGDWERLASESNKTREQNV